MNLSTSHAPVRLLFALGLVLLFMPVGRAGPIFQDPLLWVGFLSIYSVAFLWIWIPHLLATEPATMREFFPVLMLCLFLIVLSATAVYGGGVLYYTASALLFFRTLIFSLNRIRQSKKPLPSTGKALIAATMIAFGLLAFKVYQAFQGQ